MKHLLFLLAAFLVSAIPIHAQWFSFSEPFLESQRTPEPQVTAPAYKGGKEGINRFLQKEFRAPDGTETVSGRIVVACIINEKGRISDAAIRQGLSKELNAEAIRVVKKMHFKPAQQGKKKVKVQYNIAFPIRHGRVSFIDFPTTEL